MNVLSAEVFHSMTECAGTVWGITAKSETG